MRLLRMMININNNKIVEKPGMIPMYSEQLIFHNFWDKQLENLETCCLKLMMKNRRKMKNEERNTLKYLAQYF